MQQPLYLHTRATQTCIHAGKMDMIHLFTPEYNFSEGDVYLQFSAHKSTPSAPFLSPEALPLSDIVLLDLILHKSVFLVYKQIYFSLIGK